MKLIAALAVTLILGTTTAIAQTTATAPASATPATSAPAAKPTTTSCKKQAAAKNLTGADKTQFVKDCKAAKASS
jgi:hypothetical protein